MDYLPGFRYLGKCQLEVTPLVEIRRDGKVSIGEELPSSCSLHRNTLRGNFGIPHKMVFLKPNTLNDNMILLVIVEYVMSCQQTNIVIELGSFARGESLMWKNGWQLPRVKM